MADAHAHVYWAVVGGLHYKPLCRKVRAWLAWCHLTVTGQVGICFPMIQEKIRCN